MEQRQPVDAHLSEIAGFKQQQPALAQAVVHGAEFGNGIVQVADHVAVVDHVEGLAWKRFGHGFRHAGNAAPVNELHLRRVQLDTMRREAGRAGLVEKETGAWPDFE